MDLGLAGRVALVTGASQGIGRGIAAELVAEGARVAVSSRSRERIDATARELGATGFVFDSLDLDRGPALLEEVAGALGGPVEILVVNTGGPPSDPDPTAFATEQWERAYRELVLSPVALIEAALPAMRARSWGRIVSVSSASVVEPIANLALSTAHRSALLAHFKTLSRAVASDGITLNTLVTGRIATGRIASLNGSLEEAERVAATEVPAGRLGTVQEMAAAAAFLCSTRAAYITGTALRVDGGLTRST
jgi:3-oxoacyl-[acyl-carrier protein] reductase